MSEQRRLAASTAVFGAATAVSRVAGRRARDRRRPLLRREPCPGRVPDRVQRPEPRAQPGRRQRDLGRVRAGVRPAARGGQGARGVAGGEHRPLAGRRRSWARSRRSSSWSRRWLMPLFVPGNQNIDPNLVVELSRWMFPIVAILGMTGVVTGILNSYEIFGLPALAPIAWNARHHRRRSCSSRAAPVPTRSACCVATIVQFLIPLPLLRGREPGLVFSLAWRNPHVQPGPAPDDAGHDRPRADQLQPDARPGDRDARARRPRRRLPELRVPHVHAAAGAVLGGGLGGALPAHLAARRPRRHGRVRAPRSPPARARSSSCCCRRRRSRSRWPSRSRASSSSTRASRRRTPRTSRRR